MVHTEIVLQRDSGKSLGSGFNLYMFLGFDSLMKTVAPASAFHDTAGLLVNNLDFAVHDNVFVVFIEHGVGFEQLLQSVNTLTLNAIEAKKFIFLIEIFLFVLILMSFKLRQLRGNIGQYKQVGIAGLLGQPSATLIGKVGRVELFVYHKIQRLYGFGHFTVVILHVEFFRLEHAGLDTFFRKVLDERLIFGQGFIRTIKGEEAFLVELVCFILI